MAACSNPEFDARTDTVYSLDTPSVTAKAYPGVNVVSWQPVAGADSYNVTVYEEGVFKSSRSDLSSNSITDTKIVNGKKYTYYVEAVSKSDPAKIDREVYAKNSRGEASVTAIVPPAGTSALELPAYESGYDGNTKEVKDDKFVVSKDNIDVTADKEFVYVNIPAKAYLTYTVDIYDTDLSSEINGSFYSNVGNSLSDSNSNNVTLTQRFLIASAGKYKVVVRVNAYNNIYKYREVEAGEIEIEGLGLSSETGDVSAKYLSDGKTARIEFTPAKKDGVYVPTSWYKVYRHVVGEYATTPISGAVKEAVAVNGSNYEAKYYIDDEIADTTKEYEYIVVVENDGKYGTAKKKSLQFKTNLVLDNQTGDVYANYLSDGKTARISFEPAKKDKVYVPTSWYKVYRCIDGEVETTLVSGAIKENTAYDQESDSNKTTYYIDDEIVDTTKAYQYIVVVENNGKYGETKTAPLSIETDLGLSIDTYVIGAEYLYTINHFASNADNTVRISFGSAFKDGEAVPTSWYKVYRNEKDMLDQIKITGEIMTDNKYPKAYVIYDTDKSIDPSKDYVYTVVVENDGKTGRSKTATLPAATKPQFTIDVNRDNTIDDVYNNIEWTFTVGSTDFDVENIAVYLLVVTNDNQKEPKINEVIAMDDKLSNVSKVANSNNEYVVSKKGVPDGRAYVVVTATCDGYENAISNLYKTTITKPSETD